MSPLRSVTEHIRLQRRTEKQQLLRVLFCLSVSKICRGCHNKIKINLFSPHIVMDSTCGGRGSVVNAMSSHLFLLDFLKVRFCLPCEQRLHLRRRCELACKKWLLLAHQLTPRKCSLYSQCWFGWVMCQERKRVTEAHASTAWKICIFL